jgi:hypothetical protein
MKLLSGVSRYLGVSNLLPLSAKPSSAPDEEEFDPKTLGPKKVFMSWETPSRPQLKSKNRKFNRTFIIIGIVLGLLLAAMQEIMLIFLVASVVFINYALSKSNPDKVSIEISNHGIMYSGAMYYWHQMRRFFFKEDSGESILMVDLYATIPGRLFIIYSSKDRVKLKTYLEEKLSYLEEAPRDFLDKAYDSVSDKFDFEGKES